jgi:hypothetical protein
MGQQSRWAEWHVAWVFKRFFFCSIEVAFLQKFHSCREILVEKVWVLVERSAGKFRVTCSRSMCDKITDPTRDFLKRVGMSGRWRPAARMALRRHRDREGRRRATVPWVLFTRALFTPEGCEELAARICGLLNLPTPWGKPETIDCFCLI